MNRVQQLATAARSPTAKLHELRLKYWNKDLDVICCFEGGDDIEFYLPHVRNKLAVCQDRVGFVNCGGKGLVLNLWQNSLSRKWNLARLGFFVDRDLDDFISGNSAGEQLYITDEYSIESYAATDGFFNSVWQETFRLSFDDPRYAVWLQAFRDGQQQVARALFPIFYTAVAIKRAGGGVEFDRVDMSKFYGVYGGGEVRIHKSKPNIECSNVYFGEVSISQLRVARKDLLAANNFRLWLRGKAVLGFAMTFLAKMKQELCARGVKDRCKIRVHFNDDFAMSCLCSRAQLSLSLSVFLDRWRKRICGDDPSLA